MTQEETGAAGGAPRRAFRTPPDAAAPDSSSWDPEEWWSFGEAADRAGVPHRTLQEWADRGEVMVRMAWREGLQIRLVRAGDVARLAPAAERSAGGAASLEQRALFTGPRRSALGAGVPSPSPRAEGAPAPEDDREAWRRTAEEELRRLREELRIARRASEGRGRPDLPESPAAAMDLWSIEAGPRRSARAGTGGGARRWPLAFALGLALGVALGAAIVGGVGDAAGSAPGDPPSGPSASGAPPLAATAVRPASASDPAGERVATAAGDTAAGDTAAKDAASTDTDSTETASADTGAPNTAATASSVAAVVSDASPEVEAPAEVGRAPALPMSLATVLGRSSTSLDGVTPCAFAGGDLADRALVGALGPCFGLADEEAGGVLATDRVAGVPCCKHHATVQRLKGVAGDPRARAASIREAAQARREGMLPPMVELRAERAAMAFSRPLLLPLLGGWRSSGLDGWVEGRQHRWAPAGPDPAGPGDPTPAESAPPEPERLALTSWVERASDGALRRYRLVVELSGGADGDRALSFQWLD